MINNIAYLAPEIPSISGTFVYQEILALQAQGVDILPISVHKTKLIVREPKIEKLATATLYLYQQSLISVLIHSIAFFIKNPKSYLATLTTVLTDISVAGLSKLSSWKLLYQFFYASRVAGAIEENRCQHLHIHFANVPTQIGMYASLLSGVPYSFTSHANDIFDRNLLLKQKTDRAKAAITISEYNYKYLSQQEVDTSKLKIVRCGINTNSINFISNHNVGTIPRIGSLGRLVEKKGMDDLILAVSELGRKGIDFRLEIGGDGPLNTYLKELAATKDLSSKIEFKGAIPNDQVYSWLKTLDIFVLACKEDSNGDKDGIPVVLMEAMTIGVPVISTNISGIPELIQDEKTGFLARSNDPKSLACTIEKFLYYPHPITQITQAARDRVTEEFELKNNVDRLLSVFNA